MNKVNYQKELDDLIKNNISSSHIPTLLLHSCCAPCSSYVLEYLSQYFSITVYYYNPNIFPQEEYDYRIQEQNKLINALPTVNKVSFVYKEYLPKEFMDIAKGYEKELEGGERCIRCYRLRLESAAQMAAEKKYDYFATTLTISPMKNADKMNQIGNELARKYEVEYLPSDFKKKNGYKRSIELSKSYDLYRQNYCGCVYSKLQQQ